MDAGIYYLYEHKNNQKIRNTGFLKITRHGHACLLQLNARNIPVTPQDTLKLAAFYMENDSANAMYLSDIPCGNHTVSEKITANEALLSNQNLQNRIDGFFLQLPNGTILTAAAPNVNFDTRNILFLPSKTRTTIPEETDSETHTVIPEETGSEAHTVIPEETNSEAHTVIPKKTDSETTEEQPPERSRNENSEPQCFAPANSVRKIQRSDLSCLPRRHWNIANNSFLLHGYYNYNHLLLIEEDGHYWLGVPGIYDPRESHAAELFGFSQFTDSYNHQLALTDEECNDYGRFGYWCRYLK